MDDNNLESILLGSRLKRLGEKIIAEMQREFKRRSIKISPRLVEPLFHLYLSGPCAVSELSRALAVTHAAVSQMVKNLTKMKLAQIKSDKLDDRRTIISITSQGKYLIRASLPALKEIKKTNELVMNRISPHFFQILSRVEAEFPEILFAENYQKMQDQDAGSGI